MVMFYIVPALIALGALGMAYKVVRRAGELRAAWRSGLTAEGRCLRAYTTHGESSTTQHHLYGFTTAEGREVRFEERNGSATVVAGDYVTVHYTAARPEKATATAPRPVLNVIATLGVLTLLGAVVAFSAVFVASVPA
ncbi:DUF3592 domain-containing protein [Streptomyces sp. NBC_01190]|uniref:DUF3592 domain-containing protein n=1 Tax=Streptomyces sp. NBC_01190 TaxID=2903767 RepID=UPI0038683D51|nr:DUF3592 domain-containing protein [Streptomyces sp. NBC_01190]